MFHEIGKKMKVLARALTYCGVALSIIIGVGTMIIDEEIFLIGLLIAVLGSFASWLSSMALYAFGELVDQSMEQTRLLQEMLKRGNVPTSITASVTADTSIASSAKTGTITNAPLAVERAPVSDTWQCTNCGTANKSCYGQCKKCGAYRTSE